MGSEDWSHTATISIPLLSTVRSIGKFSAKPIPLSWMTGSVDVPKFAKLPSQPCTDLEVSEKIKLYSHANLWWMQSGQRPYSLKEKWILDLISAALWLSFEVKEDFQKAVTWKLTSNAVFCEKKFYSHRGILFNLSNKNSIHILEIQFYQYLQTKNVFIAVWFSDLKRGNSYKNSCIYHSV